MTGKTVPGKNVAFLNYMISSILNLCNVLMSGTVDKLKNSYWLK